MIVSGRSKCPDSSDHVQDTAAEALQSERQEVLPDADAPVGLRQRAGSQRLQGSALSARRTLKTTAQESGHSALGRADFQVSGRPPSCWHQAEGLV